MAPSIHVEGEEGTSGRGFGLQITHLVSTDATELQLLW